MFSSVVLHMFNSHLADYTPGKNSVVMARDRRVLVAGFTMLHVKRLADEVPQLQSWCWICPGAEAAPRDPRGWKVGRSRFHSDPVSYHQDSTTLKFRH